jgi:uncharacterized protein YebE (UPF0316 family)
MNMMLGIALAPDGVGATALVVLLIIGLRIIDVSAGVLRVMLLVRGKRWAATGIGFIESFTWLVAAAAVFGSLDTPVKAIAYAGGFAAGTWIGSWLEAKLGVGKSVVRVFIEEGDASPVDALREAGYGVTEVRGDGLRGPVTILFSVIPRRRATDLMRMVAAVTPEAFVTVEDVDTLDLRHRRYARPIA